MGGPASGREKSSCTFGLEMYRFSIALASQPTGGKKEQGCDEMCFSLKE